MSIARFVPSIVRFFFAVLLSVCCIFLTGDCTGDGPQTEPAPGYPLTLNGLTFNEPPSTVVSLSPAISSILGQKSFSDTLVGCESGLSLSVRSDCGNLISPDFDAIANCSPDAVIACGDISAEMLSAFSQRNIKLCVFGVPKTLNELERFYRELGSIFFGEKKGDEFAKRELMPLLDTLRKAEKRDAVPRIAMLLSDAPSSATGDTIAGEILRCFGKNAAESATGYNFDYEQIIASKPDIVFVSESIELDSLPIGFANIHCVSVDTSALECPTAALSELAKSMDSAIDEYYSE